MVRWGFAIFAGLTVLVAAGQYSARLYSTSSPPASARGGSPGHAQSIEADARERSSRDGRSAAKRVGQDDVSDGAALDDALDAWDSPERRSALMAQILDQAGSDPAGALAAFATILAARPKPELDFWNASLDLLELLSSDAGQVHAWLDAIPAFAVRGSRESAAPRQSASDALHQSLYEEGFVALTRLEPDAALERLLEWQDRSWIARGTAARAIGVWARHEPLLALRRLEPALEPATYRSVREKLLTAWASSGSVEAFGYAAALADFYGDNSALRARELGDLAATSLYGGADPLTVLGLADQLPAEQALVLRVKALSHLANRLPYLAETQLHRIPESSRASVIRRIARGYAQDDAAAGLAWALESGVPRAVDEVIDKISQTDPIQAFEMALGLPEQATPDALETAVYELLKADPASAPAIADRLTTTPLSPEQFEVALVELVGEWWDERPVDAFDWLTTQDQILPARVYKIAARRAYEAQSSDLGSSSIQRLPEAARKLWVDGSIDRMIDSNDPERASAWLASLQGDTSFAYAIADVGRTMARFTQTDSAYQQTESVEEWIHGLPDPTVRFAVLAEYRLARSVDTNR
jgi:hypothetical protein